MWKNKRFNKTLKSSENKDDNTATENIAKTELKAILSRWLNEAINSGHADPRDVCTS